MSSCDLCDRADPVLILDGLSVGYRKKAEQVEALKDVSLCVHRGDIHALVGESGSGKSTLALALMGLLPLNAKRSARVMQLESRDLSNLSKRGWSKLRGSRIALVLQNPTTALSPTMTVKDHFGETLRRDGRINNRQVLERTGELLREVGLPSVAARPEVYAHELSGGMLQRVCIALAMTRNPTLLIADEPTSSLDASVKDRVLSVLTNEIRTRDVASLLITHEIGVVASVADFVTVLRLGEVVDSGSTTSIFYGDTSSYTRELKAAAHGEFDSLRSDSLG